MAQPGSTPESHGGDRTYLNVMDKLAPKVKPAKALEQTRQRLTADGWKTTAIVTDHGTLTFRATTDDVDLSAYTFITGDEQTIGIAGWPGRPATCR